MTDKNKIIYMILQITIFFSKQTSKIDQPNKGSALVKRLKQKTYDGNVPGSNPESVKYLLAPYDRWIK